MLKILQRHVDLCIIILQFVYLCIKVLTKLHNSVVPNIFSFFVLIVFPCLSHFLTAAGQYPGSAIKETLLLTHVLLRFQSVGGHVQGRSHRVEGPAL